MKNRTRISIIHYIHGLLMGSADIVPGISGGTVALIVGIYERLVTSIRAAAAAPVALLRGDRTGMWTRVQEIHFGLVLPLGLGIGTALLVGARFIPGILEAYPVESRALFFGLIAASLFVPWRRIEHPVATFYVVAAVAAVIAFLLVGLPPREVPSPGPIVVFLAASIAICAMILPGVSGSFLLLVMGMYGATLRAVDGRDLAYIAIFAAGAVVGLGVFSKLLEYLLTRHHDVTMAALVGLMLGSLRALWPYLDGDRRILAPPADTSVLVPLGLAVLGFLLVTALVRIGAAADRGRRRMA
jgi:putative membrane protein